MRSHVVLVPGFGGFDGLGQLRYYSRVTETFAEWRQARPAARSASLHYFDNLPTASVKTRARKLRRFLVKLVERNIVQGDDEIVIAGHSTGGLDIRQLVVDLMRDGDVGLLQRIHRLVFLSVPHRGTNLADWVKAHERWRKFLIWMFRGAVGFDVQLPIPGWFVNGLAPGHAALFDAVADVRCDFEPRSTDGLDVADARAARAEVELWLTHTNDDFLAIDDLASAQPGGTRLVDDVERELAAWAARGITTRSYATVGRSPFDVDDLRRDRSQRSVLDVMRSVRKDIADTDAVYRAAYTACAGGPFRGLARGPVPWLPGCGPTGASGDYTPEDWDNDGIVNTASMVLPGGTTWLVPGDHADIIGHHEPRPNLGAVPGSRKYDAYDLLESGSAFMPTTFVKVWFDVFDFAAP